MTALVGAELLKVRTVRSWWAYLLVTVLVTALGVATTIGPAGEARRGALDFQLDVVDTAGVAALLAIILGITAVTNEFRHGTVTPTFLVAPRRERVLAAKIVASALVAVFLGLLALVAVAAVALPWLSLVGAEVQLGAAELWERAGRNLLGVVLWALMGFAIGALVQSQVAALVGTLIWIFLIETLLVGLLGLLDADGAAAYLPFRTLDAADGTSGGDLLSYGAGLAVAVAWIALLGGAGALRTAKRDIT